RLATGHSRESKRRSAVRELPACVVHAISGGWRIPYQTPSRQSTEADLTAKDVQQFLDGVLFFRSKTIAPAAVLGSANRSMQRARPPHRLCGAVEPSRKRLRHQSNSLLTDRGHAPELFCPPQDKL